ncbi:AraC-like DNA-binding protein [Xanthobacter flavus]|uniref:AraC family transcriptional regulator n=1 Tax=Xanthobacter flavus TaxID=281 RepID=A0A9W6CM25_XANFL|nr:AraC family transcriptional regulator [Xanthobacter flavus]MDR6336277.1 AraC-like DNA-binding protein [Xanthobacter flavus]GLI25046.1 AraC family transcriptional regulator [Xanthobacter flavus]
MSDFASRERGVERRMISGTFVDDALGCLTAQGIDAGPVLARAGLALPVTEAVSAEQYGALWTAAAEALDDEFFGLAARPMRCGSFTLLCHALMGAQTLEQALRRALRFLRVVLDDPSGELVVGDGLASVVLSDKGGARSAFAYRTYWIILHGITCWLVGRRIPIRQVDFRCGPPEHGADYRLFFGAPVRFDAPESRLAFDATFLKLPAHRSERALRDFLRGAPANILVRYRHDEGLAARVRARLRELPASAWPSFVELARQLRLPASTLRRRLAEEGAAYRDIKDDLRRLRAEGLLRATDRPVGEIAAELGFSEPSAFHRAFRKWTDLSPGAFRRAGA